MIKLRQLALDKAMRVATRQLSPILSNEYLMYTRT